jgi:hypothetical protein
MNRAFIKQCKSVLFDTLFFRGQEISRSYARFYALENIARMPYFSYLSVLHLYESLGWWRKSEYLKGECVSIIYLEHDPSSFQASKQASSPPRQSQFSKSALFLIVFTSCIHISSDDSAF